MPTSLLSWTITAATTTNFTVPDPNEVTNIIYPIVDHGNSSNVTETVLLIATVLPALSSVALPAVSFSFEFILTILFLISAFSTLILKQMVKNSYLQDSFDADLDVCPENVTYAFLYGIDDNDDDFSNVDSCSSCGYCVEIDNVLLEDDDSLCYSVSVCGSDDLTSVFSIDSCTCILPVVEHSVTRFFLPDDNENDEVSCGLSFVLDVPAALPAIVECTTPQLRRSPRIAATPAVNYKKFY